MRLRRSWRSPAVLICLAALTAALAGPASAQEGTGTQVMASTIVDANVVNEQGEKIGEVDDLVIRRSGKVKKLTMEVGGFLDAFDKIVAVSFGDMQVTENGEVLVKATAEQLNQLPEYEYWEKGLRPEYYFRSRPYTGAPYYNPPRYTLRPEPVFPPDGPDQWAFSPARYLATVAMDRNVISRRGRSIARVQDLVIGADGEVQSLILSSFRFLGEDVSVKAPYRPLSFSAYGLVYDLTLDELEELPQVPYEE